MHAFTFSLCSRDGKSLPNNQKYYVMSPGHFKIRKGDPIVKIDTTEGNELLKLTGSFSFVRDPVSRFVSGLAETHKRRTPWALQVEKDADESGRPITTVAIESLFRTPLEQTNPHLAPQSWSLTDCNGKMMSTITHIGATEPNLHESISGILKAITPNKTRAVEWSHDLIYTRNSRNERKNTFGHFGSIDRDPFVKRLHAEVISPETKARIKDFYAIDRECLGI